MLDKLAHVCIMRKVDSQDPWALGPGAAARGEVKPAALGLPVFVLGAHGSTELQGQPRRQVVSFGQDAIGARLGLPLRRRIRGCGT